MSQSWQSPHASLLITDTCLSPHDLHMPQSSWPTRASVLMAIIYLRPINLCTRFTSWIPSGDQLFSPILFSFLPPSSSFLSVSPCLSPLSLLILQSIHAVTTVILHILQSINNKWVFRRITLKLVFDGSTSLCLQLSSRWINRESSYHVSILCLYKNVSLILCHILRTEKQEILCLCICVSQNNRAFI